MKTKFDCLWAVAVVALLHPTPGTAQVLYNYLSNDVTEMIQRVDQTNTNLMMNRMIADQLAIQHMAGVANLGAMKIKAGQASTGFTPKPEASFLRRVEPAHRASVAKGLEAFEAGLRDKNLRTNDLADGKALAFVMAYYAYRGEDPGPARLVRLRDQLRTSILADAFAQGQRDELRQDEYERLAYFTMASVAARNAAQGMGPGDAREQMIQRARSTAGPVMERVLSLRAAVYELTADGFGDRGARFAREGSGDMTLRRRGVSQAAQTTDRNWGAGVSTRQLALFEKLLREHGGSATDLTDWWTTGYAWLVQLRSGGRVRVSRRGWVAARDYMRAWALKDPYWMGTDDAERQESAERVGLRTGKLVEEFEYDKVQMAQQPPADPVKRMVWNRPISRMGTIAEDAGKAIVELYRADMRTEIERLLAMN